MGGTGIGIKVKNNNVDKAIRLFKKKVKDTKLMIQIKEAEYFEKPSVVKRKLKLKSIARKNYIKEHATD